jgi:sugar O-acyltransferase (sialic acid O-acetyltransferase NeuD family)
MTGLFGVYGASGFGREVMPVVKAQFAAAGWEIVFIDDSGSAPTVNGQKVLSFEAFAQQPHGQKSVCLAIADAGVRERLAARCAAAGIGFPQVRAANAVVLQDCEVGEGAILSPFVTLTANIRIGRHFHANIYSYVAHDCVIGDFVTFAPGVKCNGNVVIGDHAYIGTGAIIRQGQPGQPMRIGRGAVVGMGAVVTKPVPDGVTVVGNPARPLERG